MLDPLYPAVKVELAWPPLAMFKAPLLVVWHDLSDVKLPRRWTIARRFAVSAAFPPPIRPRSAPLRAPPQAHGRSGLDRDLFDAVTAQLEASAIKVKTGTLVDALSPA